MFSWVPLPETAYGSMEEESAKHIHLLTSNLPVSKTKLEEIKEATVDDQKQNLKHQNVFKSSGTYIRDELSDVDGVILKNGRTLVPSSMRKEMLQRIHQEHMEIKKSKRRARDVLFWWHDIKIHHLLRVSTAKHERANDPFSHTKQALRNGCDRLVYMRQIWIPDHFWLSLKILWRS